MTRAVFETLFLAGVLAVVPSRRVLEIGPKHGQDTRLLAGLSPAELAIVDLPDKQALIDTWWDQIACPKRRVTANLLYMDAPALAELGRFALVWCTGVLYHNAEQLRLIRRLFNLCDDGGRVVIESEVIPGEDRALVQVCWPEGYRGVQTITHLPSREAVRIWMEMAGFRHIQTWNVSYPPEFAKRREVWTGIREPGAAPARYYRLGGMDGFELGGAS